MFNHEYLDGITPSDISEQGYRRAIKEHTYGRRVETIFSVLKQLKSNGKIGSR